MGGSRWSFGLLLSGVALSICSAAHVMITTDETSKIIPLIGRPAFVSNRALSELKTDHSDRITGTNDQDLRLEKSDRQGRTKAANVGQFVKDVRSELNGIGNGDRNSKLASRPNKKDRAIPFSDKMGISFRWWYDIPAFNITSLNISGQESKQDVNDSLSSVPQWKQRRILKKFPEKEKNSILSSVKSNKLENTPQKLSNTIHEEPKFQFEEKGKKFKVEQVDQTKRHPLSSLLPLEKRAAAPTLWSNLKHPFGKHASPESGHLAKRSVHSTPSRKANDAIVSLVDGDALECGVAWTVSSERLTPIYEAEMVDFFPRRRRQRTHAKNKPRLPSMNQMKVKHTKKAMEMDNQSEYFQSSAIEKSVKLESIALDEKKLERTIGNDDFKLVSIPTFPGHTKAAGLPNNTEQANRIVAEAKTSGFPSLHSAPAQKLGKSHFSQVQKEQASSKTGVRNDTDFAQQVPQLFPWIKASEMEVGSQRRNRTTESILVSGFFSEEDLRTKNAGEEFEQDEGKPFIDEHQKFAELGSEQVNPTPENLNRTSSSSLSSGKNHATLAPQRHLDKLDQSSLETLKYKAVDTANFPGKKMRQMSPKMREEQKVTYGPREKIIGGRRAMRGAFPWMAALVDKMKLTVVCGGTIVSQGWVLTAAHCALKQHKLLVSVGEHNVRRRTGREMYYEVKEAYIHEKFDHLTYDSDIALLHLSDSPVKVSMGGQKPPRDVTNVGGIPVFSDAKKPSTETREKMELFNSAFHIWRELIKCLPDNGSLPEDVKLEYLRYLSIIFKKTLEKVEGESLKPGMCLPSLFVSFFSALTTEKQLPNLEHCETNTKNVMPIPKQDLKFLGDILSLQVPVPGKRIKVESMNNSKSNDNGFSNMLCCLTASIDQILPGMDDIVTDIINDIKHVPFLYALLQQTYPQNLYSSDHSAFPSVVLESMNCSYVLPEEKIESIIEPRSNNRFKSAKSQVNRGKRALAIPPVPKTFSTRASDENQSSLLFTTPPTFPHYSACLPNPQFFKSAELESMSLSSSNTSRKINEYQETGVRSTVNPSSLKKAPSNKVANSSKPVSLGRASRFLIRSIDSIHDSQEQSTDHFFANGAHNKATRGRVQTPAAHSDTDTEVEKKGTRSRNHAQKSERAGEENGSQKLEKRAGRLNDMRLFHDETKIVKEQAEKASIFTKAGGKFREFDQQQWESVSAHMKRIELKKQRSNGDLFERNKLRCVVLGWGQTAIAGPGSDVLRHAKIPILSPSKCEEAHASAALNFTENMLCAGDLDASKDTCKGDSGGPLLCEDRKDKDRVRWAVVGVTSFGVGCGQLGVYTNVQRFTDWIKDTINNSFK